MIKPITPVVIAPPALRADAPRELWDHQLDAIAAIHAGVARQQVAMACGTGKTVVGQHGARTFLQGRPGAMLVLAPTLALLKQNFDSWALEAPFGFRAIAVCSKLTGVKDDIDISELTLPATVDPDVLTEFITADTDDVRVVFATYQSLQVIIDAHAPADKDKKKKKKRLPKWDAVLCDEAHRTAGPRNKKFARVLYDDHIPAVHRLFLTATPRVHSGNDIASMDDEKLYGKRVYQISVAEAVALGILSEYEVAVIGVEDSELATAIAALERHGDSEINMSYNNIATVVALSKAARDHNLQSVIAFFNSIPASKAFVAAFTAVHAALGDDAGTAEHIDGHMNLPRRGAALKRLAAERDHGFHLVSNARCLSEGIDVPVLNAVVFGEPRSSQTDVVQCVGRGIRRNPRSDDPALIILAVRIGPGDDPETAIAESEFTKVRQVINALEDHDPRIMQALRARARTPGKRTKRDDSDDESQLLSFDIPERLLTGGFALRLLSADDRSFEEGVERVRAYAAENGHARVHGDHVSPDGHRTGIWVSNRRADYAAGGLSADRIAELEAITGWVWSLFGEQWANGISAVTAYVAENGHARVPDSYVSLGGHRTGGWVGARRRDYAAGTLSADRIAELEAIDGWVWNPFDEQWTTGLAAVTAYVTKHGDARVPTSYVSPDGHRTGRWVSGHRNSYVTGRLTPDRIAELESLPGWVWNWLDEKWATGLAAVRAYVDDNGHARVPLSYVSPDGHRTGGWVGNRRADCAAGRLSAERVAELEALPGWVWAAVDDQWWVDGLAAVTTYVVENGHARVPDSYVSLGGHRTGGWVKARRGDYTTGKLTPDRIAELEALPGWVWRAS